MEQKPKKRRVLMTPAPFGSYDKRHCEELEAAVGEQCSGARLRLIPY